MRPFERAPAPAFISLVSKKWGEEWKVRKETDAKASFSWRTLDGEPTNHLLLPPLKAQTQAHCSFCDNFPVSPPSLETIEHFRPKAAYPLEAYEWENLYFCCDCCQQKLAGFDERLLRPDAKDFVFDRYFIWEFSTGELKPNPAAAKEDQVRAEITIRLYKLNVHHPLERKRWLRLRAKMSDEQLDVLPYRGFIV